jgi:hypothetical protein
MAAVSRVLTIASQQAPTAMCQLQSLMRPAAPLDYFGQEAIS